ncbi:MAG: SCO family protein [Sinobacteraceae bacterium]|nr:SCO family protein [Nevskiaceae bacterium]
MAEPPYGHEPSGLAVRRILSIGAVLAVTVVLLVVLIDVILAHWVIPEHAQVVARLGTTPPTPRLQPQPQRDLTALRAQKSALLATWSWADATHQFARVPIERAMTLLVQQHTSADAPPPQATPQPVVQTRQRSVQATPRSVRAPPDLLTRVGLQQQLGASAPVTESLTDTDGAPVRLSALLQGRPTVLVPGYYACTNLCSAVRAGLARAIEATGLTAGEQFNVLLVSIDARETPEQARSAQVQDAARHPRVNVDRWHYLTASASAREGLMRTIGYRSWFDARTGEYAHPAGIVLLSPAGIVTQYLLGVQFAPQTLRLALIAASQGRLGTLVDRIVLLCCDYDPATGRYSLLITRILQILGLCTTLGLSALIFVLLRRRAAARQPRNAA